MGDIEASDLQKVDLFITGAGYVGLSLAIAVKQAVPELKIIVVDAKIGSSGTDSRASALGIAVVRMFQNLKCWQSICPFAEPIREIIITDSHTRDPVRPVFLTFAAPFVTGEPFAYMVENRDLNTTLRCRADELGVLLIEGVRVESFYRKGQHVCISLENGICYKSSLLVGADGVSSKMRERAGIKIFQRTYDQTAIVCTVLHERPHNGRAIEHFLENGPFAILPLKGNRSSLVWSERTLDAEHLLSVENTVFEYELVTRFGYQLGPLQIETGPFSFPLGLTLAHELIGERFALVGDAAHSIHPIAGQGLNLGFRDAAILAEVIVDTIRLGLDIGSTVALERYQGWCRFENFRMGLITDVLNRVFSNNLTIMRIMRDIGLGLVDRMPHIKEYLIRQASGLVKGSPRLFLDSV
ncbi:MAG: 2-octaprenyl-6-methoxyphenol hydroxylase [Candidatus Tokpelaia sp. JSC161]|nr:MAG: 2-octaprenyl-6-methoxyphenol hydroxylase [Candidatus Tokpelaia sp. JSC161]